jgi:serine/threonine protein phosphatase PrpC
MKVRVGAKSDIGRARERNEDSFITQAPLFAVADGMGGHRGGNVASAMALETLQEVDADGQPGALIEKVKLANGRVLERGEADRDLQGMGTTLTAVLADGDKAHIVHIGDSRAYLLRDGAFRQVTRDHTLVQRMVDEGRLTRDEAEHHPQRSILTRALGVEAEAEPDPITLDLHPGDRLLLCTDGLTGMVDEERIREVLESEPDPQQACDRLIDEANAAGGEDNITVIVLDFEQGEDAPDPRRTAAGEVTTAAADGQRGAAPADPARPAKATGQTSRATTTITQERTLSEGTARPTAVSGQPGGPGAGQVPPDAKRRRRKLVIWAVSIVAVLAVAVAGIRVYVQHQWYVGDAGGRVAIYNGIPTTVLSFDLSHVKEMTSLSSAAAERLAPWRGLHDGITAKSLSDARSIVEQIRQDLQGTNRAGG